MALQVDDPLQPANPGYGYIGGGFYIPQPYVPPKPKPVVKPKPVYKAPAKSTGSTYNEQVPNYKPAAQPYTPKGTGSTYNEQVPKYTPTAKAAVKTAINNTTTSNGGGSSGGGGSVATPSSTAVATPTATATSKTPSATTTSTDPAAPATTRDVVIPDITLDPTYQNQVKDLAQQLTDAQTSKTGAEADYDTTYNSTLHNLGWDPNKKIFAASDPNTQYGSAFRGNLEDYTGRGLGYSSDYVSDLGNLNNTFTNQVGQLGTARTQFRGAQDTAWGQYQRQNTEAKSDALSEAAARIAASLGIDQSQVPLSGGKKSITVPVTSPTSS